MVHRRASQDSASKMGTGSRAAPIWDRTAATKKSQNRSPRGTGIQSGPSSSAVASFGTVLLSVRCLGASFPFHSSSCLRNTFPQRGQTLSSSEIMSPHEAQTLSEVISSSSSLSPPKLSSGQKSDSKYINPHVCPLEIRRFRLHRDWDKCRRWFRNTRSRRRSV